MLPEILVLFIVFCALLLLHYTYLELSTGQLERHFLEFGFKNKNIFFNFSVIYSPTFIRNAM